ncbi:enoyl-CoA hydratase-related protein [Tropicibacter sp. Alg240-R139]|uniref:enoyl-CoA hydratase-related protein n=1 Tax=Tropicibacter sp. Alg240-R139 TaxID=2305991 RepID=UPI0013DEA3B9|nr:enoyl-CoA hydratase-related protein [Tropicibacter sp. Alg240-R139]
MNAPQAPKADAQIDVFAHAFDHILVDRNGPIFEVTINRPGSYNALFGPAHRELETVFDAYENDPSLWVAIITGAGDKTFCSGNDLKATNEGGDILPGPNGFGALCNRFDRAKPIIAAVNGIAMGGGLEIALACDLNVAAPHAKFALPEVRVGLFAAGGGVMRLAGQIGRKAAMELILTRLHFDVARALELGVINSIAAEGQTAMDAARDLATEITLASPQAVSASLRILNRLEEEGGLVAAFPANLPLFHKLLETNDAKEGVAAFVEKRAPRWTNS